MSNQFKNILVVRTDRIGDVVLSLPLARIIKEKYHDAKVTFLVREYTQALVENHPYIDEVLLLKENQSVPFIFRNVKDIKKHNFDTAIIVYPTFRISLIIFLAGIKNRIGSGYRLYSFLFNKKVYEHRSKSDKHELEYNLSLLSQIGIEPKYGIDNVSFDISINKSSLGKIEDLLNKSGIQAKETFVIIHPGSGGSAVDLPLEKFEELIKLLSTKKIKIVLTGNEKEMPICERLKIGENVFSFAGQLNLSEMIALISKCSLLVANSTGPIHIAAALGKYTFGFYPKVKVCSATRWGPYTKKKFVYEPDINCEDCTTKKCAELNCMSSIDIQKVYKDILTILDTTNGVRK